MRAAWNAEAVLLRCRWPELLFLLLLSLCVGLYRALGPGEVTAMGVLTCQRFAFLPYWGLAEVVFRSRQGELSYRASVLSGCTRGGALAAKLTAYLLLALLLEALGCAAALLSVGCFSPAVLPPLLLRIWLDLGFSAVLPLTTQLPFRSVPTRHILNGGSALLLGLVDGMRALPLLCASGLLIVCPVLTWALIRRCEL